MNGPLYDAAKARQRDASARLAGIMSAMLRNGHVLPSYTANARQALDDYLRAERDAIAACDDRRDAA